MPNRSLIRLAEAIGARLENQPWHHDALRDAVRRIVPGDFRFGDLGLAEKLIATFPQPFSPSRKRIARVVLEHPILPKLARHCQKTGAWPVPNLSPPRMHPAPAFANLDLPQITTTAALADWQLIPPDTLDGYVDRFGWREAHGDVAVNHYFTKAIPKATGTFRLIEAPKPRLKSFQRQILARILSLVPQHPDSHAFQPGKNCQSGAARHAGEEVVIAFDLQDFFNTIPVARVFGLFRCLGYPSSVAHALAGLCTVTTPARVLDRLPYHQRQRLRIAHLPQGAPTSPALSNIVCDRLDRGLTGLARAAGAHYSRYADDMTFSGDHSIRRTILAGVADIVQDEGFILNDHKTRVMPAHRRQIVTGLVVNKHLNIKRRDFDRLKACIHSRTWMTDPAADARLMGQIGWVEQINPPKGQKLLRLMQKAAEGRD